MNPLASSFTHCISPVTSDPTTVSVEVVGHSYTTVTCSTFIFLSELDSPSFLGFNLPRLNTTIPLARMLRLAAEGYAEDTAMFSSVSCSAKRTVAYILLGSFWECVPIQMLDVW